VEDAMVDQPDQALQTAISMIASSPEFHTTSIVRKTGNERPAIDTDTSTDDPKPYKALVHIFLEGGCDSYNMLVPHSCSETNDAGQDLLEQYLDVRANIALTEEERSRIISAEGQPCEQFAIHHSLPTVERLYNSGELSFFANTGSLNQPVTKDNYYKLTQTELFAHNTMQEEGQRVDPLDTAPDTGMLGRMCDILMDKGYNPHPITIEDTYVATTGGRGNSASPVVLQGGQPSTFAPGPNGEDMRYHSARMNDETSQESSIFGETWSSRMHEAISSADTFSRAFEDIELTQDYSTIENYGRRAQAVSEAILSHEVRGSDRDVIFMTLPKWDQHVYLKADLSENFVILDGVLSTIEKEMKAQGLWEQVTVMVTSEFGRTLTPNSSAGSDHAWGGNYMILGGDVDGGKIHGEYPSDLTDDGPLGLGRGRMIPSTSWESMFHGALEWMGVETEEEKDYCMPNRRRAGTPMIGMDALFQDEPITVRNLRGAPPAKA